MTSVTVTVQLAADAVGIAATPNSAAMMAVVSSATLSFPRFSTVALSPPDQSRARTPNPQNAGVSTARY